MIIKNKIYRNIFLQNKMIIKNKNTGIYFTINENDKKINTELKDFVNLLVCNLITLPAAVAMVSLFYERLMMSAMQKQIL